MAKSGTQTIVDEGSIPVPNSAGTDLLELPSRPPLKASALGYSELRTWTIREVFLCSAPHRLLTNDEITIIAVASGTNSPLSCCYDKFEFTISASRGNVLLAPPKSKLAYTAEDNATLICLTAPFSAIAALMGSREFPTSLFQNALRDTFIFETLQSLLREVSDNAFSESFFANQMANSILTRIASLARRSRKGPLLRSPLSRSVLIKLEALIDQGLEETITLNDLAEEVGMSVFQFARAFRAATGQSPMKFVLYRRIKRARECLETQNMSIAEVAYACGFSSQAHMTSAFSKHCGTTPGQVRRRFLAPQVCK